MCPGSHIRRARGATPGRESPDVQVPDGPAVSVEVGWLRGRASLGAAASCERCSVVNHVHRELPLWGSAQGQLWRLGAPSLCRMGEGQRLRGSNLTPAPAGLSAVWAVAPRQGSMFNAGKVCVPAKTRPDGNDPAYNRTAGSRREGRRLAAEAVRAMTARTTQPRSSKGPLGGRGRALGNGRA